MAVPPRVSPLKEADLLIPDGELQGEQLRQVFRRLFAQINPFFDSVMRLGGGATISQNDRADLITASFVHGVATPLRLQKIQTAKSAVVRSISGASVRGTPSVRMQPLAFVGAPPVALVTLYFTNPSAANVTAMVELREEGISSQAAPVDDAVRAYYQNPLAIALASGANTVLSFGTAVADTDSAASLGPPWTFTVPSNKGGVYLCSATVSVVTPTPAAAMSLRLLVRVNGAPQGVLKGLLVPAVAGGLVSVAGSMPLKVNAFDIIDFAAFQDSGVTINTATTAQLNVGSWCSIVRLLGY